MARLPQPGGDKDDWGTVLNDYLSQSLRPDGGLRDSSVTSSTIASNSITSVHLAGGAVSTNELTDNSITEVKLDSSVRTKLNSAVSGGVTSVNNLTGVVTLTKSDIGLANVDNTADTAKPISVTTQAALDGKAALSHTHTASQISDATTIGRSVLTAADAGAVRTAIGAGTSSLVIGTTTGTAKSGDYLPTKSDVGLSNVDNTADTAKPVSTATQTALNLKANTASLASVATSGDYTQLINKPTIPTVPVTSVAARTGDVVLTKSDVNLGSVDNTTDLLKPVSTATQNALNLKANISSLASVATSGDYTQLINKPTIPTVPVTSVATRTGDIVLTPTDVGLANVNNTADINKPISTAVQTALSNKADISSLGTKVLLVTNAAALPPGTPAGVIVVVKS